MEGKRVFAAIEARRFLVFYKFWLLENRTISFLTALSKFETLTKGVITAQTLGLKCELFNQQIVIHFLVRKQ